MMIFQFIIGFFFLILFLSVLFFVAWYIALPILLILVVFSIFGHVWDKVKSVLSPDKKIEHLEKTQPRRHSSKNEVIDVDYTEV
ncbi:MAG: hypothetical protein IKY98_01810 [Alphaproteobacteria bacterium]|nr:hypothetical protein [Alphaproteobacteria bacterium]